MPPPPLLPPDPQPIAAIEAKKTTSPSMAIQLRRRRAGMPKKQTSASAVPPAEGQKNFAGLSAGLFMELVAAVVLTVSVEVSAPAVIETDVGASVHVGASIAPDGLDVTEQDRLTAPVNEFFGVTVIVDVFPEVAPGLTEMFPLLVRAKVGAAAAVTVTLTVVLDVIAPDVPVTVTA